MRDAAPASRSRTPSSTSGTATRPVSTPASSPASTGGPAAGATDEQTYLRGAQVTNADGIVEFRTIYPGWYPGRTVHIHVKVHLDRTTVLTSQLFFDDAVTERCTHSAPTASPARHVLNDGDGIFAEEGLLPCGEEDDGVLGLSTWTSSAAERPVVRLRELVDVSAAVAATPARGAKTAALAELLARLAARTRSRSRSPSCPGASRSARSASAGRCCATAPRPRPSRALTLAEVDAAFAAVGALRGPGSQAARRAALAGLLARADAAEQDFLVRLLLGDLAQGALGGRHGRRGGARRRACPPPRCAARSRSAAT